MAQFPISPGEETKPAQLGASAGEAMSTEHSVAESAAAAGESCCCCATLQAAGPQIVQRPPSTAAPWGVGTLDTPAGLVPQVDTRLRPADHLGAWRARWGVGRMRYRVDPGLYAVGRPTSESPVLVSANYKLSFDTLRSQLAGIDAWLLVLDTQGVNVWCSAGKGTFGTDEIVGRVKANRLDQVVSHRTLILPQLAAPGVAAHQVKNRCGFRVVYGPVRAADLPAFLANGMKATPEMRRVAFPLWDRLVLVPIELVRWAKYAVLLALSLLFLAGLGPNGYSWQGVADAGVISAGVLLALYVASNVLGPALLPWLPGRALSLKGAWLGVALAAVLAGAWRLTFGLTETWAACLGWGLLITAIASFITMNFAGSTTYTSLSGVRREMRVAVPLQLAAAVTGIVLWVAGRFV